MIRQAIYSYFIQNLGAKAHPPNQTSVPNWNFSSKNHSEFKFRSKDTPTQPHQQLDPMSSNDIPMANADAAAGKPSELLVWPWTGVIATITTGSDATSTLASYAQQHFAGVTTTTLQEEEADNHHHCHFLLLHFGKTWAGLRDAMSLAFHFAGAGRSEWQWRRLDGGDGSAAGRVFSWVAGEEDMLIDGAVGRFLRESGAKARSVEDVQEEARHAGALEAVRDDYERRETFLDAKSKEMARLLQKAEQENSRLLGELKG